ncbi:hypothetical protein VE02_03445 [Pseudogymnoascus sp. 03VT05]|nr:hypothetical protein VE02_03445 [Pseudogymnoascus sp. 03VT05]
MQMILAPFEAWGDLIANVASAAFPPTSSIMGAMLILVRGARKVSEAFDGITDLFRKLGNFALRLDSYKGVPLSEGMKAIIVNVLVNFLRVCGVSQKCLSSGSLRTRLSKGADEPGTFDGVCQGLNLTHQALRNTEELLQRDGRKSDREKLERVKASLNPVSASGQIFSSINENRIPGSGSWIEDRIRTWWQGSQPLLWLHGGPGVGKSHLASKIITDLSKTESPTITPPMALRTLAWQIATQRPCFATHAEEFSLKEDPENSYIFWRKLLVEYFVTAPLDATTCFVIDGIDEVEQDQQEIVFSLLERTFGDDDTNQRPPLRVVLLKLNQPHRIRSVLDFAFTHFQDSPGCFTTENSERNTINSLGFLGRIEILTWQLTNLAELKYFLATLLFEKGQVIQSIQGWYEVAALSEPPDEWYTEPAQNRSIYDLAALCLSDEDISFAERSPIALDKDAEYSDVFLVISSWRRNHGDMVNARNALRGRVRQCVSLLSDDDPWNDNTAFLSLFKSFLATGDSDTDLGAVLYLVQLDNQQKVRIYEKRRFSPDVPHGDTQGDLSESLGRVQLDDAMARDKDTGVDADLDDVSGVPNWFCADFMTECSGCRSLIETFHWRHSCRSCTNKGICRRCYLQFHSPALANPDDAAPSTPDKIRVGVCDPQHEFYYTGPYLRSDDLVPEEEWETADFEFEGGLSAWCSRVLPEPQRTRWATFFC